jgi:hypothetical protein
MSSKRGGSERRGDSRRGSSPTREEQRGAGKNDGRQVLLDGDAAEAGRMEVSHVRTFLHFRSALPIIVPNQLFALSFTSATDLILTAARIQGSREIAQ